MMATPRKIRYASVCDGIGAVHVAWQSLGWQCTWVSEIEPFPNAVVEHHFGFPNLGDMTKITEADLEKYGAIDLLVGGTPCQSFSIAGLRKGLDDPRGNLALRFLHLVGTIRPRWVLWENVPGVLSSSRGRDFGLFLGSFLQLGYGFAYRILDAQYFGVAQRRRRVFALFHLGDWRRAAAVLFERDSLSGHSPPSRAAREGVAHATAPCIRANGLGFERAGESRGQDPVVAVPCCFGGNNTKGKIDTATALNAKGGAGRMDFESETLVTHSLRADGFDASEDGTGRGTPLIPVAFDTTQITSKANFSNPQPGDACHPLAGQQHPPAIVFTESMPDTGGVVPTLRAGNCGGGKNAMNHPCVAYRTSGNRGVMEQGDRTAALNCNTDQTQQIIAFKRSYFTDRAEQSGAPQEVAFPLTSAQSERSDGETCIAYQCHGSNVGPSGHLRAGNGNETGGIPFIFQTRVGRNGRGQPKEIADALTSSEAGSHADSKPHVAGSFGVRRLTPRECERLQGFPDDYTLIDFRGKPAKDGPRYKALGNSMAVPVMRWIGQRIMQVEAIA